MLEINHQDTKSPVCPWNRDKIVGQKLPLKLKEIWAIRIRLQLAGKLRDLALFNLAIDSKLRACDLVKIRIRDISHQNSVTPRATVMQQKTQTPVQFEITEGTRESLSAWISHAGLGGSDYVFPSRAPGQRRQTQSACPRARHTQTASQTHTHKN